ncbi:hypothetical protein FF1_024283 [Malus domestica]
MIVALVGHRIVVAGGICDYEDDPLAVSMNCTTHAMMAKLKGENDCAGAVLMSCMRDMVFPDLPAPLPRNVCTACWCCTDHCNHHILEAYCIHFDLGSCHKFLLAQRSIVEGSKA